MIDFVHPGEQSAWIKLSENKIFQYVIDVFQTIYMDLTAFAAMKGRNFLITENTMPDVYRLYYLAGKRLGISELPPLYLQMEYTIKIQTLGTDGDCAILINSACLEECSDEQLLALFGQELTHICCGHLRILNIDTMLDTILAKLPMVGPMAAQTLKTLLLQWKEYSYYTADRGAAIAAGEKTPVFQNLSMAMGRMLDKNDIKSLLDICKEKEQLSLEQSAAAKVVLQMMINSIALPFGMWRIRELEEWDAEILQFQQQADILVFQENKASAAKKTVDTMDWTVRGLYHGAIKTAEAVQTGKQELSSYIKTNKPVWENNISQAKEKTVEAVRVGKQEVTSYLKEKTPEWKDNLSNAQDTVSESLHTGVKDLSSKFQEFRNKHKQRKN